MANPTWPTTLPANPFGNDDPTYTPSDNVLRTAMQSGPAKARPLFTAVPEALTMRLQLTASQRDTLRHFLQVTLGYVLPFDWVDFRSWDPVTHGYTTTATYRYAGTALPPEQYLGNDGRGNWWLVQLDLEMLP